MKVNLGKMEKGNVAQTVPQVLRFSRLFSKRIKIHLKYFDMCTLPNLVGFNISFCSDTCCALIQSNKQTRTQLVNKPRCDSSA
jgi:hypothetical protein